MVGDELKAYVSSLPSCQTVLIGSWPLSDSRSGTTTEPAQQGWRRD
jgi:hypothetical protein